MSRLLAIILTFLAGAAEAACEIKKSGDAGYAVCIVDPQSDEIRLFLNDEVGAPYRDFDAVNAALADAGEHLVFAMNAGMYHRDRTPVGLYVEAGEELKRISTREGPGNFHLLPNGVFWVGAKNDQRGAHVRTTQDYLKAADEFVVYATQSGPMLVIDGEIHPRFLPDSDSFKRRNGVGVRDDGAVIFAISDEPVRFYDFALFFRDELETPNALYLDGTISRLYAPELSRNDPGLAMGPIVGVVTAAE